MLTVILFTSLLSCRHSGSVYYDYYHKHPLSFTEVQLFSKQSGLTGQHFIFTVPTKLSDCTICIECYCFCIKIYEAGWRFNSFKFSCNMFGIKPPVNSTKDVIQAVFSCHILTSSSFKSLYFCSFSVTCWEDCDCWELLYLLSVLLWWFCQV